MKKNGFSGYILLESLVSLMMIFIMTQGYLQLTTFLMSKTQERQARVAFYRAVYIETKRKNQHDQIYEKELQISFETDKGEITKVAAQKGRDRFVVEKQ